MSRSLSSLRRILFGTSCAVVFGFGASRALASPATVPPPPVCTVEMEVYCNELCGGHCVRRPDFYGCECV
jgi:hypothetical protein